jgi:hypothetical protein
MCLESGTKATSTSAFQMADRPGRVKVSAIPVASPFAISKHSREQCTWFLSDAQQRYRWPTPLSYVWSPGGVVNALKAYLRQLQELHTGAQSHTPLH